MKSNLSVGHSTFLKFSQTKAKMDTNFARQLINARLQADMEVGKKDTKTLTSTFDNDKSHLEELKYIAENEGVHISFLSDIDLSVQCAMIRAEHENALLKQKAQEQKNNKKFAVKNVEFGKGCC